MGSMKYLVRLFTILSILYAVESEKKCSPMQQMPNTTIGENADIIDQMYADDVTSCNDACCAKAESDQCTVALFDTVLSECYLIRCQPIEECQTGEAEAQILTFIQLSNDSDETAGTDTSPPPFFNNSSTSFPGSFNVSSESSSSLSNVSSKSSDSLSSKPSDSLSNESSDSLSSLSSEPSDSLSNVSTTSSDKLSNASSVGIESLLSNSTPANSNTTESPVSESKFTPENSTEVSNMTSSESSISSNKTTSGSSTGVTDTTPPIESSSSSNSNIDLTNKSRLTNTTTMKPTTSIILSAITNRSTSFNINVTGLHNGSQTTESPASDLETNVTSSPETVSTNSLVSSRKPITSQSKPTAIISKSSISPSPNESSRSQTAVNNNYFTESNSRLTPENIKSISTTEDEATTFYTGQEYDTSVTDKGDSLSTKFHPTSESSSPFSADEYKSSTVQSSAASSENHAGNHARQEEVEVLSVGLISALCVGIVCFFCIMVLVGKRFFDSWQRRHYSRMDYLINGMYN